MAVRSLNKNGYGEQWDMPGYVASGGTSQINPQSVPVNPSDEERISLSFNTWAKGNLGNEKHLTYLPLDRCV